MFFFVFYHLKSYTYPLFCCFYVWLNWSIYSYVQYIKFDVFGKICTDIVSGHDIPNKPIFMITREKENIWGFHWSVGEPRRSDCIALNLTSGSLFSHNCREKLPFVCENSGISDAYNGEFSNIWSLDLFCKFYVLIIIQF